MVYRKRMRAGVMPFLLLVRTALSEMEHLSAPIRPRQTETIETVEVIEETGRVGAPLSVPAPSESPATTAAGTIRVTIDRGIGRDSELVTPTTPTDIITTSRNGPVSVPSEPATVTFIQTTAPDAQPTTLQTSTSPSISSVPATVTVIAAPQIPSSSPASSQTPSPNIGAIAGGAVAGFFALVLIALAIWLIRRARRNQRADENRPAVPEKKEPATEERPISYEIDSAPRYELESSPPMSPPGKGVGDGRVRGMWEEETGSPQHELHSPLNELRGAPA